MRLGVTGFDPQAHHAARDVFLADPKAPVAAIRPMPPLDPDQLDDGREEDTPVATSRAPGPVQPAGSENP
jgi:hypothetical protein